jgi:uncharacterized phage-associated protein
VPIPYDPKAVANYFLEKGKPISQMKLHKLVYYAHGWNLAIRDEPLINEAVEAWSYGPVVPSLYHEFKDLGSSRINRKATTLEVVSEGSRPELRAPALDSTDLETRKLLDRVWDVYGGLTAAQLSGMTHKPGTPWTVTRNTHPRLKGADIPNELIQKHFKARLKDPSLVHA